MENPFYTGVAPEPLPDAPPDQVQWADFNYVKAETLTCARCSEQAHWRLLYQDAEGNWQEIVACAGHAVVSELTPYELGGYKPEAVARLQAARATG